MFGKRRAEKRAAQEQRRFNSFQKWHTRWQTRLAAAAVVLAALAIITTVVVAQDDDDDDAGATDPPQTRSPGGDTAITTVETPVVVPETLVVQPRGGRPLELHLAPNRLSESVAELAADASIRLSCYTLVSSAASGSGELELWHRASEAEGFEFGFVPDDQLTTEKNGATPPGEPQCDDQFVPVSVTAPGLLTAVVENNPQLDIYWFSEPLPEPSAWPSVKENDASYRVDWSFLDEYEKVRHRNELRISISSLADRQISITNATAEKVRCVEPDQTTRIVFPADGGFETIGWHFDLDEATPEASVLEEFEGGEPYFTRQTVLLEPRSVTTIDVVATTDSQDCEWLLILEVIDGGALRTVVVGDREKPFRASPGADPWRTYVNYYFTNEILLWESATASTWDWPPDRVFDVSRMPFTEVPLEEMQASG